jgi:hypothetical protein
MKTLEHLDLPPFDTMVGNVVDAIHDAPLFHEIADTVTETVVPTAQRSGRQVKRSVRRHPRSYLAVGGVLALIALVWWMRRRNHQVELASDPVLSTRSAA